MRLAGESDALLEIAVNRPADISAVLDQATGGFAGDELGERFYEVLCAHPRA